MKSMLWTVCLIMTVVFMFGLIFVEAVTANIFWYLNRQAETQGALTVEQEEIWSDALRFWSSMGASMLTLFQASTGGLDWNEMASPLWQAGGHWYAIFLLYIGFFLFVVMNTLTSLFIDISVQTAAKDERAILAEHIKQKEEYMIKLAAVFDVMDGDGSGAVTYDELSKHLRNPRLRSFAESLEIDVSDVQELFAILSNSGEKLLTLDNFVTGCIKIHGAAKSIDVLDISIRQRKLHEEQIRMNGHVLALRSLLADRCAHPRPEGVTSWANPPQSSSPSVRFEHFGPAPTPAASVLGEASSVPIDGTAVLC